MFSKIKTTSSIDNYSEKISKIQQLIKNADAVIVGAGAGLSASAGLLYSGVRFETLFTNYIERYNLRDMYSSAFYPHNSLEEHWGYWCKHIYHNRYAAELNTTYPNLQDLLQDKNYFVITTNGDHLFLLNGFEKERVFYTQGDYGLFQCSVPCHQKTYDNHQSIIDMLENLEDLKIPSSLIPYCPVCGKPMTVNLRMDDTFVEGEGWNKALKHYQAFIENTSGKNVLFLELGIGYNTPAIIKYPFWRMTYQNKNASYVCINLENETVPQEIKNRSILMTDDIGKVISDVLLINS